MKRFYFIGGYYLNLNQILSIEIESETKIYVHYIDGDYERIDCDKEDLKHFLDYLNNEK